MVRLLLMFMQIFPALIMASCSDQGPRYSYSKVQASAYGRHTEQLLDELLEQFVTEVGLVNYEKWKSNRDAIEKLEEVLRNLADQDISVFSLEQTKAFLINAYNVMTLDLILKNYPSGLQGVVLSGKSIQNINNLGSEIWNQKLWTIAGRKNISLNEVERWLLSQPHSYDGAVVSVDARIHFAINCASMGCPPIRAQAFRTENIEELLDVLSEQFVNSGRDTEFSDDEIVTSMIVSWYRSDFSKHFGSTRAFFKKFVKVINPSEIDDLSINLRDYDWHLNELAN